MDIFKRPVVIIIVFVAIIIAIGWSYFTKNKSNSSDNTSDSSQTTQSQLVNLTNVDATEYDETIKKEYASAKSKAEQANPGNKLCAIQIDLSSLELKAGDTRYIFSSESNTQDNWIITFSRISGNFVRAAIPKNDKFGELTPINTALWKFNYVTAIQIAEKNGGKDWRNENGFSKAEVYLEYFSESIPLVWNVKYYSGEDSFFITIDSATGNIVEQ